jgi:nickel/cobalt transporter (NicO) family protein
MFVRRACADLLVAAFLVCLFAAPAAAQTANPLLSGGVDSTPSTADGDGAGPWQQAVHTFVRLQRHINRALTDSVADLKDGRSLSGILIGIGIAFLYGVFHAAGPGHGKAVVVSYFISRPATMRRCVAMGAQIALFHVISAVTIVVALHWILQRSFSTPVDQLQFLKVASYGTITAIGMGMLVGALRRRSVDAACAACAQGHDHGDHHRGRGAGGLLSLAVGVIPCSGAVIILVFALANGILMSGLIMTGFIALGMAMTLALIAMTTTYARGRMVERGDNGARPQRPRLRRALELLGPCAIACFGGVLLAATLAE